LEKVELDQKAKVLAKPKVKENQEFDEVPEPETPAKKIAANNILKS